MSTPSRGLTVAPWSEVMRGVYEDCRYAILKLTEPSPNCESPPPEKESRNRSLTLGLPRSRNSRGASPYSPERIDRSNTYGCRFAREEHLMREDNFHEDEEQLNGRHHECRHVADERRASCCSSSKRSANKSIPVFEPRVQKQRASDWGNLPEKGYPNGTVSEPDSYALDSDCSDSDNDDHQVKRRYTVDVYLRTGGKRQPDGSYEELFDQSARRRDSCDLCELHPPDASSGRVPTRPTREERDLEQISEDLHYHTQRRVRDNISDDRPPLENIGRPSSIESLPVEVSPPTISIMEGSFDVEDSQSQVVARRQNPNFEYKHLYTPEEIEKIRRFVKKVYETDCSGWLEKKNHIFWGYKARFVEIKGFDLAYYKHAGATLRQGNLDLGQTNWTLRLDRADPAVFTFKEEPNGRLYTWKVMHPAQAVSNGIVHDESEIEEGGGWNQFDRAWWFEQLRRKLKAVTFISQLDGLVDPTHSSNQQQDTPESECESDILFMGEPSHLF